MKKKAFITGHIKDFARGKGWFFGHFMDEKLLKSDLVDVAWQEGKTVNANAQKHYHVGTVEINIVIAGSASFTLNGQPIRVTKGDFYVIWPETVIDQWHASNNAEFVIIRAPSIKDGGKVNLQSRKLPRGRPTKRLQSAI